MNSPHRTYLAGALAAAFFALLPLIASANRVELLSTANNGLSDATPSGASDSGTPIMTPDGRYVAFASTAGNLVRFGTNRNGLATLSQYVNVYLRDRVARTTLLVSVSTNGLSGGNSSSMPVGISTNGQFVLFESAAGNLVTGDTNGVSDVFVRDVQLGNTILVSVNTNGVAAQRASSQSAMSPDGRFVVFLSEAADLTCDDTNSVADVFVRDRQDGTTKLLSGPVSSGNTNRPYAPAMSANASLIAFYSIPVANFRVSTGAVYALDSSANIVSIVGSNAAPLLPRTNSFCHSPLVSPNAQFVIYQASTLSEASFPPLSSAFLLRYDVVSGRTELLHNNVRSAALNNRVVDMTPDGEKVVFVANTDSGATNTCIVLWDANTGSTNLVSGDLLNQTPAGSFATAPVIDPTGRYVLFLSSATGLVTNQLSDGFHLFVRDLDQGITRVIGTNEPDAMLGDDIEALSCISSGGRYVAFASQSRLASGDHNRGYDVFVHDLLFGTNELISVADSELPNHTPNGPSSMRLEAVSSTTAVVAFSSLADNLVADDTNGASDVFVRNVVTGEMTLVSANTNGLPASGNSTEPCLSADGKFVAFTSCATDLALGMHPLGLGVLVRNLETATMALASVDIPGIGGATNDFHSLFVSEHGRFVLFANTPSNAVPNTAAPTRSRLFLRDFGAERTYQLSASAAPAFATTPDGHYVAYAPETSSRRVPNAYVWDAFAATTVYTNVAKTDWGFTQLAISPDGGKLVWVATNASSLILTCYDRVSGISRQICSNTLSSKSGLRFSAEGRFLVYSAATASNASSQVILYDTATGGNQLISHAHGQFSNPANGNSDWPDISPDGRFVAYRSIASDLVVGDDEATADIFIYDRASGSTVRLTVGVFERAGKPNANSRCGKPAFVAGGQALVFESWASDLVAGDFGGYSDLFAYSISSTPIPVFKATMTRAAAQGVWLIWPVQPDKSYRVQFKNGLAPDEAWQDYVGGVSMDQSQAYLYDAAASPQRFYRVISD